MLYNYSVKVKESLKKTLKAQYCHDIYFYDDIYATHTYTQLKSLRVDVNNIDYFISVAAVKGEIFLGK